MDELTGVSGLYALLGRLWLSEVDLPLLRELCDEPMRDLLRQAGISLADDRKQACGANETPNETPNDPSDDALLETLAIDYCRTFVGPSNHFPPYQSVWESGQYQSRTVDSMRRFAEIAGVEVQSEAMPDHLGVQMSVMSRIVGQLALADGAEASSLGELATTFFAQHLAWAVPRIEAAVDRSATAFYVGVIRVTAGFLADEAVRWDVRPDAGQSDGDTGA